MTVSRKNVTKHSLHVREFRELEDSGFHALRFRIPKNVFFGIQNVYLMPDSGFSYMKKSCRVL